MSLERLNDLLRPIDTGLKAVVVMELSRNGEIDAPSLTRNLVERGVISMNEQKTLRKKIEGVKGALEGMTKLGYADKFDTGEFEFQTPRHTYKLSDNGNARDLVKVAELTAKVCADLYFPCHEFWNIKGGSFSIDLKHVRQGMQMASFYGIMLDDLEASVKTDIWEILEAETLPSIEIQARLGLNKTQMKSYLTKFVAKGFFNQSSGISNGDLKKYSDFVNNGYTERKSAGNARLYSLSERSQRLVKDLFIPCLCVASGCSNGESGKTSAELSDPIARTCVESKVVDMHYGSIKNQFN